MRLYLAGPMRGIPEFNFPMFNSAAKWLREQGHEVFNPAEEDAPGTEATYKAEPLTIARECFLRDTSWICTHAEGVILLPGWNDSLGAKAERALAQALDLKIGYLTQLDDSWMQY